MNTKKSMKNTLVGFLMLMSITVLAISSTAYAGSCVGTTHSVRCSIGHFSAQIECYLCHYPRSGEEEKKFLEKFTDETKVVHETEIYPKNQYHLKAGQKMEWGPGYLLLEEDGLELFDKKGNRIMTFPPASMILKNSAREPALLHIPEGPKLRQK